MFVAFSKRCYVLPFQLTKADGKLQELDKEVLRQTQETEAIREENRKVEFSARRELSVSVNVPVMCL